MAKSAPPLISTYFAVSGPSWDPEELTRVVQIAPTEVQKESRVRGTLFPSGEPNVVPPTWWLSFYQEPLFSIDEGLQRLLDLVWPKREIIKSYVSDHDLDAQFGTNVTITRERPLYSLEPPTLERLSYFGYRYMLDIII